MRFELLAVVDRMLQYYQKPRSRRRFQEYISMIEPDRGADMVLPVGAYNPMAGDYMIDRMKAFQNVGAEDIIKEELTHLNSQMEAGSGSEGRIISVVLCVADDQNGKWTNRYTADYDHTFRLGALLKRDFCTPVWWVTEMPDQEMIRQRTREFCARTIFRLNNPDPVSLEQHIVQEIFVSRHSSGKIPETLPIDWEFLDSLRKKYGEVTQYDRILNYFYGDAAFLSLGYGGPMGIEEPFAGFLYARHPRTLQAGPFRE